MPKKRIMKVVGNGPTGEATPNTRPNNQSGILMFLKPAVTTTPKIQEEEKEVDEETKKKEEKIRREKQIELCFLIAKLRYLSDYRSRVQKERDIKEEEYRRNNININREGVDHSGKSAVHMLVSPLKYGSYENV